MLVLVLHTLRGLHCDKASRGRFACKQRKPCCRRRRTGFFVVLVVVLVVFSHCSTVCSGVIVVVR